jgi:hypothetical protein
VIRVSLVCVADTRAQGMVAYFLRICGRIFLRTEGPAYMLASGKFQHIVFDRCALGAALGTGLDVYIRHVGFSGIGVRWFSLE